MCELGGEGSNLQPHEPESCALPVAPPPNGRTVNLADLGRPRDLLTRWVPAAPAGPLHDPPVRPPNQLKVSLSVLILTSTSRLSSPSSRESVCLVEGSWEDVVA
jgi:hypothetical protein